MNHHDKTTKSMSITVMRKLLIVCFLSILVTISFSTPALAGNVSDINKKAVALYKKKAKELEKKKSSSVFKKVGKKYIDITGDGIKEALFWYRDGVGISLEIYTYKSNSIINIFDGGGYGLDKLIVYKKTQTFIEHKLGKGEMFAYYKLTNGKYEEVANKYNHLSYTNGKWRYTSVSGNERKTISKKQYNSITKKLKKGKKKTIKIVF